MEKAKVVEDTLSDGSTVWNVEYVDGYAVLTFGCNSKQEAELLAECIDEASWVQISVGETLGRD